MRRISEEGGACGHGRQHPGFPLHADILFYPARFGDEADQGFGLRRVETSDDKHPCCGRIKLHGTLTMSDTICFSPGRPHGGCHDVPGRDRNIGDQRLGAMTAVFTCHAFHQAWRHGPGGMGPLMSLHAGLLLRVHDLYPVCMQLLGVVLPLADRPDVCIKWRRVRRPVMIEPIPRLMRFQVRSLL